MKIIRKENFINDKRRISYLNSVYSRIYRGKSVLIEGDYGAGKSRFLQLIKPKKLEIVWVESGLVKAIFMITINMLGDKLTCSNLFCRFINTTI